MDIRFRRSVKDSTNHGVDHNHPHASPGAIEESSAFFWIWVFAMIGGLLLLYLFY